jgi:hypothetical protein
LACPWQAATPKYQIIIVDSRVGNNWESLRIDDLPTDRNHTPTHSG